MAKIVIIVIRIRNINIIRWVGLKRHHICMEGLGDSREKSGTL